MTQFDKAAFDWVLSMRPDVGAAHDVDQPEVPPFLSTDHVLLAVIGNHEDDSIATPCPQPSATGTASKGSTQAEC